MSERSWFVGERTALALIVLFAHVGFFVLAYLAFERTEPLPAALAALYGFTFFAVAARWFFARWLALGIALTSAAGAAWAYVEAPIFQPVFLVLGVGSVVLALSLLGGSMSAEFEGRAAFTKRFKDSAIRNVGLGTTLAAALLPVLLWFALAPG